ncbi:glycoside hydrolase family 3 C-terminal domain-containing protein [Paractinoplanes globisporus]|uniref:Glycoside hydrolase family 3 C-terminal domain-containing protein n=1 Tax=Paractinoplanes globisporus TaxID=113565 RepID=A0ABW6W8A5_9ACTN|nr:glycoside hydrolase family 3 C-terminal domain-containing protein [Actinoplanes globisporus]
MVTTYPLRRAVALAAALLLVPALPVVAAAPASAAADPVPVYLDAHYSFGERAADLVSRMTLPEKVLQLHTNNAPAIPRLGVQQYTYWSEGQHGINRLGADVAGGSQGSVDNVHATSFPTNFASSMSWDPALMYRETTAISDEARGFLDKSLFGTGQNNLGPSADDYGSLTYWAPTVNLDRDPRWGRTDESFGEDPYLVGRMAGAYVEGYQGQGTPYLKVAATAKHFALNNVEDTRNRGSSDTTDANLRDYYLRQFQSLIEDADVSGLMTSYNAINGTPSPADTYTTDAIARRTYGLDGYVTSDCGAVGDIWNPGSHNWAPPGWTTATTGGRAVWTQTATGKQVPAPAGGQAYALRAGTDVNCTGDEATLSNIQAAIQGGILSEGVVDQALVHLFTLRMRTGEFDPPARVAYTKITKEQIESPAHQTLARSVAANSLVLLKNEGGLLPADPAALHDVVIVGDLAGTVTLGGYSGDPTHRVSPVQGITDAVKAADPAATVTFDPCGTSTTATAPAACSAATQDAIRTAGLVVVFVGTDGKISGEGNDRDNLAIPGNYRSLIDQVHALGNPRTALAMQTNGPIAIADVQDDFPAIVFSGYNGQAQGDALADVLFGAQNPSGRLNFTWYRDDSQLPAMENYGLAPGETNGLGRTYQDFTGTPTYPFGYGLSYTDFRYAGLSVPSRADANDTVDVRVSVTNTGSVPGATVAQIYVASPPVAGRELPIKRLAGFAKTKVLQPGRTERLAVPVKISDLSFWDERNDRDVVQPGVYQFQVATDAAHVVAQSAVRVSGRIAPRVTGVTVEPGQIVYRPGDRLDLTGVNPWIGDDTAQAAQHVAADHVVEAAQSDHSFADLRHAHVTYRSSDPRVATVTSRGLVTAHSNGAATISATVDGVTGSAPIVVRTPFAISAPAIAQAGGDFTATTSMPNPAGGVTLRTVTFALGLPAGWTATTETPATFRTVPPGRNVATTWTVHVPAGAAPAEVDLAGSVTFTDDTGRHTVGGSTRVSLPYPSLAAAYNNTGISDDANPSAGSLDGGALSYSAQALAAANPALRPGESVTHDGTTFTWPDVAPGTPDNVVASGQTIAVSGTGPTLGIVGAANNGTASGAGTIVYADGTTQPYELSFNDWWSNSPAPGSDILTSTSYINSTGGRVNQRVSMYFAAIPLDQTKAVKYVTLPEVSHGPVSGLAMHIFALAVNRPLTLTVPAMASPGDVLTATTSLPNGAGSPPLSDVAVTVTAPDGWTVEATAPSTFPTLPGGASATTTWKVSVPAGAVPGAYPLTATAAFTEDGTARHSTVTATVSLPYASFAAALDNPGISDDGDQTKGSLDGGGYSLSAQALAAAGLTPGGTFTHDGIAFAWPGGSPGEPDNIVANGQTVPVSGAGARLGIVGTSTYGEATGTAVVTYTDGSTQKFTLDFNDWWNNNPTGGGDTLATMPQVNTANGSIVQNISLYAMTVPLTEGKTVRYLTLPAISDGAHPGTTAMHVFAAAVGP